MPRDVSALAHLEAEPLEQRLLSLLALRPGRELALYGVDAAPKADAPGVYVGADKIASLGLRVRRGWVQAQAPLDILLSILEQKVENMADSLEDIHRNLEEVSYLVLEDEEAELEDGIEKLAHLEDSNGKIRLCLMDTQRSISFIQRYVRTDKDRRRTCSEIQHDLDTLMSHATFLFEKINFLMDSTQGFINIEQNQIIKIFSIAAVVFLPPTMIASIYGMNFDVMPELQWAFGYPAVLGLMILSGIAPYWYFKRKGWL